ncbi:MAG TPA: NADH-quinone oxidoreductase subunit D [Chloroflexi bacterium]|nr:NADH-quinone oxidoreductase subunit D [Chloroflexota bacterium]
MNEEIKVLETYEQAVLERFPDWVRVDEREGYQGLLVESANLLPLMSDLRDELGYDLLTSLTGVDYLPEEKMEVVYHLFRSTGGAILEIKVQIPRSNPVVPSLVGLYPGAAFQEREAWDLLGIKFEGHPHLKRILMWEGFSGHPLRKDWQEVFYGDEKKPYEDRWPKGKTKKIEADNPYQENIAYPEGFNPETWIPEPAEFLFKGSIPLEQEEEFDTEKLVVNLGPQHPSTHGVFRMVATLDGETVVDLEPVMGYLHRNHEKIGEKNTFAMNMPYTDRLDYFCSMSNNFGYALAVEKLLGEKYHPPERAQYIRVIMAELTRVLNHFMAIGFFLNDLGAYFTPALYTIKERELILDIFEAVAGSRMMCNYFRFGGVVRDLPQGMEEHIREMAYERLPRQIDELDRYLVENEIVVSRGQGVGVLTPEQAIGLSAAGPVLRASGVPYDIRRADPYSIYDRFDFDVAVRYHGDVYDRFLIRFDEIRQSIRILQQAIDSIPQGEVLANKPAYKFKMPVGEAYGRVEGPKGELGFYVVSDGTDNPWRYHVRAPSFINLTGLRQMCLGEKVADLVAILGSIDIVLGEVDR